MKNLNRARQSWERGVEAARNIWAACWALQWAGREGSGLSIMIERIGWNRRQGKACIHVVFGQDVEDCWWKRKQLKLSSVKRIGRWRLCGVHTVATWHMLNSRRIKSQTLSRVWWKEAQVLHTREKSMISQSMSYYQEIQTEWHKVVGCENMIWHETGDRIYEGSDIIACLQH